MASVVFFRAVNVGGHLKFQPSRLAQELNDLNVTSIGAAGTFVVRAKVSTAKIRELMLRRLPFAPGMMICSAESVRAFAAGGPFRDAPVGKDVTRYVTVLERAPKAAPQFPFVMPDTGRWELQFLALRGKFLVSVRRPGRKDLYPNAVAEKLFGGSATTRNWNTIETICRVLVT